MDTFLIIHRSIFLLAFGFFLPPSYSSAQERPNILWITCEDISPYLGSYGCAEALTPNLDRLAEEGIRYTHAYANAPVCAVARSTLLTGMYAPTLGTHNMRCNTVLPDQIPAYPRIFREAGYYCTNNSKKDYNSPFNQDPDLWDESSRTAHYKNRKEGQPFFAVFNITVTHESQLSTESQQRYLENKQIPPQPRIAPEEIALPPYHPDLPAIRNDWARYHDLITLMDQMAGDLLHELATTGEADNTIVFFYSDHGGMLARSKRYIYNVGTQVPLIIRFPSTWQHLAPGMPGSTEDRLVSFIDFPKTVISITGLPVPELMQGQIFLGPDADPPRSFVHFSRDRMGERFDCSRAITDGRYYYIRNFMPHRPRGRDSRYGYTVQANWGAWQEHYDAGLCNDVQSQFFEPKPPVELFDTQNDPWHINNLADDTEYREQVDRLSAGLDGWMIENRDLGLVPEPFYQDLAGPGHAYGTLYDYAQDGDYPVEKLLAAAKQASLGKKGNISKYIALMESKHPVIRYYGAYGMFLEQHSDGEAHIALNKMVNTDPFEANRLIAAQALGVCGDPDTCFEVIMAIARSTQSPTVFLQALNAFQHSKTDDRLSLDNWKHFREKRIEIISGKDMTNLSHALRIVDDAIAIWPERRVW
jgi:arylsulfatase A-like enzyme